MKKLMLIPILAIAIHAQPIAITDRAEIAVVAQYRANVARQACFEALRACPDTNAIAKATAILKSATPIKQTNSLSINRNPASATTQ